MPRAVITRVVRLKPFRAWISNTQATNGAFQDVKSNASNRIGDRGHVKRKLARAHRTNLSWRRTRRHTADSLQPSSRTRQNTPLRT